MRVIAGRHANSTGLTLQAKAKVQEAIDVDGGERVQSAVEAGLLEASRRRASQEGASTPSEKEEASEQQQGTSSSTAPAQEGLQETSDEQLQAAIKQLRGQQDSDPGHKEGSNGSETTNGSAVPAESSTSRQS